MGTEKGMGASAPTPSPKDICKGERVFIVGMSPHAQELDLNHPELLSTGKVIAINKAVTFCKADFWIARDTDHIFENEPQIAQKAKHMGAVSFLGKPEKWPKIEGDFFWAETDRNYAEWYGELRFAYTTAVSAVHLACIMGAKEIVLYGVDFVGQKRRDNDYSWCWDQCADQVSDIFRLMSELSPIYKLHPDSPIQVPLMKEESYAI